MIVTLKDIADRVGVHPSTVSRVLREKDAEIQTSNKKRKQIIQLAKELNYQPNQMARSFRLKKSQTIGYIIPDISNAFYAYFAKRLEQEGDKFDLSLIICNTDGDLSRENKYINKLYARGIDGIIIAPAGQSMNSIISLKKLKIPYVVINPQDRSNNFDLVNNDSYNFLFINENNFDKDQYAKDLFAKLVKKMNRINKGALSANSNIAFVAAS